MIIINRKDIITEIINDWDPIGVLPYAPIDEYEVEISEILSYIDSESIIDTSNLAHKIRKIFLSRIDSKSIVFDYRKCYEVAKKIYTLNL
ncbi:DUF1871 family protein [Alkaliphilus crotonatoxidans]